MAPGNATPDPSAAAAGRVRYGIADGFVKIAHNDNGDQDTNGAYQRFNKAASPAKDNAHKNDGNEDKVQFVHRPLLVQWAHPEAQ